MGVMWTEGGVAGGGSRMGDRKEGRCLRAVDADTYCSESERGNLPRNTAVLKK